MRTMIVNTPSTVPKGMNMHSTPAIGGGGGGARWGTGLLGPVRGWLAEGSRVRHQDVRGPGTPAAAPGGAAPAKRGGYCLGCLTRI